MKTHYKVFKSLIIHVGLLIAIRLTLAKIFSRVLNPFGKNYYSQTGEDLILDFLVEKYLGRRTFNYVDIGCHDSRKISTTYYHYLRGCSGLCLDFNPEFAQGFFRHRPKDRFVCAALSDKSELVEIHEFSANAVNTINVEQAKLWGTKWSEVSIRKIESTSLNDLLIKEGFTKCFDVLLLDVEGHEEAVLKGCDFNTTHPALIICELHDLDLYKIKPNSVVDLLKNNGYQLVAYATMNGYFVREDLLSGQSE